MAKNEEWLRELVPMREELDFSAEAVPSSNLDGFGSWSKLCFWVKSGRIYINIAYLEREKENNCKTYLITSL